MEKDSTSTPENKLDKKTKRNMHYEKNRDRLKQMAKDYYYKNRSKILLNNKQKQKDYYERNKEAIIASNISYYKKNKEAIETRRRILNKQKKEKNILNMDPLFEQDQDNYKPAFYNSLDEYLGQDNEPEKNNESDNSIQHSLGGRRQKQRKTRKIYGKYK